MTIKELRILPPFAIGRLGSAEEPLDNYTISVEPDPDKPLGFREIQPAPTFFVDPDTGGISHSETPESIAFKDGDKIRPVAPFLELFAITDDGLEPVTLDLLHAHGLGVEDIAWQVSVASRKVVRRTNDPDDLVSAETEWFSDHAPKTLRGHCNNFVSPAEFIDYGRAQFIAPNAAFPEIRLRFTPAKGLIYGPDLSEIEPPAADSAGGADPSENGQVPTDSARTVPPGRSIYDPSKSWYHYGQDDKDAGDSAYAPFRNETLPPSLYAIEPPAPSWLYDNVAVSRGYLDDACDGFVEAKLTFPDGRSPLSATARICAAPPALAPDSLFVRCLADDLDQVINGPEVNRGTKGENGQPVEPGEPDEVTHARALDIVRRAYETVRYMNVAVMNGNDFKGRPALSLDSMPEEEAADTERAIRPIMASGSVDTLAIMTLHQQAYAAMRAGTAPWFVRLLRSPDAVADFTDRGRRKMPAMMCGADNNYLALTWRQIDTIRKASEMLSAPKSFTPSPAELTPRNLSAQINYVAHGNPISSRPISSVANCCPGLEVDFRAVWRRMFRGIELREYDNLVVEVDSDCDKVVQPITPDSLRPSDLRGRRLLRVFPVGDKVGIAMMTQIKGPASSDPDGEVMLTTDLNPSGLAALEWSNALARVLSGSQSQRVRCDFSADEAWDEQKPWTVKPRNYVSFEFEVQPFFDGETAVISQALAQAGELTQGLCSPWQNDYRECSCYYWASARPDYVNVELGENGLSRGDNWMQKKRTGNYVADDYADTRLIMYDELFENWEKLLKFQVGGRDVSENSPDAGKAAET